MHRFFIKKENIFDDVITIEGDDVQHISRVLRLGENDRITLCDGEGTDYLVSIAGMSKSSITASIIAKEPSRAEAEIKVVLYQGIPKAAKMETIIQKCTEMGICRIVPVYTVRTIVKLESQKDEKKKVERWSKIAEEAGKQSGRGIIPMVEMPMTFEQALDDAKELDLAVIPYELEADNSVKSVLSSKKARGVGFFIGPEGGFEASEVEKAKKAGIMPVTLGKRILRTETAGLTVLACIMYEYNQME